jgi:hypothetical protein
MPVASWLSDPVLSLLSGLTKNITSLAIPIITAPPFLGPYPHGLLWSRNTSSQYLPPTESLYSAAQKRMIQQVVVATSSFTSIAVLITFWYFWRMQQKRLRHKLVILSILGCFIRGVWYFIFSITVIRGKVVKSTSSLCQAAGFFIHVGNEMSGKCALGHGYIHD